MNLFRLLSVLAIGLVGFTSITASINSTPEIEIITDESLGEHEVVLYALSGFKGSYVSVKLGFVGPEKLKEFKVYTIRSIRVAPQTKLIVHYIDKDKETIRRTKDKTEIRKFTRLQVAKYGDFEDPIQNVLADPNSKIKGIIYNSLKTKDLTITPGKIDASQIAEMGMNFFKSYELAPGYEMKAFAFSGFKGDSQLVRGKGTLDRLCKSLILRKISNGTADSVPELISSDEVFAVIEYTTTKKQVKIKPGNYDQDQLKASGIKFVQAAKIPDGYELWAYPFSGFKGDPIVVSGTGKLKRMAMSIKLKKSL